MLVVVVVATRAVVAAMPADSATSLVLVKAATSVVLAARVGPAAMSSGMVTSVLKTVACQAGVALRAVPVARPVRLVLRHPIVLLAGRRAAAVEIVGAVVAVIATGGTAAFRPLSSEKGCRLCLMDIALLFASVLKPA